MNATMEGQALTMLGARHTARAVGRSGTHNVYVVLLDDRVWRVPRFQHANPGYCFAKPCVYVGRTGTAPEQRFWQHRRGYKSCWFVRNFGHRLMPELYEAHNPMTYEESTRMEERLANRLREEGYAVWQK